MVILKTDVFSSSVSADMSYTLCGLNNHITQNCNYNGNTSNTNYFSRPDLPILMENLARLMRNQTICDPIVKNSVSNNSNNYQGNTNSNGTPFENHPYEEVPVNNESGDYLTQNRFPMVTQVIQITFLKRIYF